MHAASSPPPAGAAPAPVTRAALRALPKVELHCHLLGAVRRRTFEDLVAEATRRDGAAPLPPEEVAALYTRGEKPVGAIRVLRALERHLLRRPDHFHRLVHEYLQDAAAHNVRHAEFFWNPTGSAHLPGLAYRQVLPAIRAAIADARRDFGIQALLIPAIDREAPPAEATELVRQVLAARCDEVPGIGIDYRETDHPPEHFAEAYALARAGGLKTTAHAGEFGCPWTHVATALDLLQVDRIDHGYTIVDHPPLLQRAVERGTVFTVVPTNSHYLRTLPPERWAAEHPIRAMMAAGLAIHPNTDDPTLHQVDPTGAWAMMVEHFGAGWDDIRRFLLAGLDGAWIADDQRRAWRHAWLAELQALQQAAPLVPSAC